MKTKIRYIRLDEHENAIVEDVAHYHGTSLAAAIRYIIRAWKREYNIVRDKQRLEHKIRMLEMDK